MKKYIISEEEIQKIKDLLGEIPAKYSMPGLLYIAKLNLKEHQENEVIKK